MKKPIVPRMRPSARNSLLARLCAANGLKAIPQHADRNYVTSQARSLDETRARRIAENEAMFRQANEHIDGIAERGLGFPETEPIGFLCECAHLDCDAHLYLTHEQYEAVRRNPLRFAILPGHNIEGAERVVDDLSGAVVVEKMGSAKQVVLDADPRSV